MDYEMEYNRLITYLEQQREFYKAECRKGRLESKMVVENRYKYDIFNKLCITTEHLKGECNETYTQ